MSAFAEYYRKSTEDLLKALAGEVDAKSYDLFETARLTAHLAREAASGPVELGLADSLFHAIAEAQRLAFYPEEN